MRSTPYSCQILMKLEFSPQILDEYSDTKFRENPFNGSRVFPCGQTDGRTRDRQYEANSCFSQFRERP